jgi:hypothetical protein
VRSLAFPPPVAKQKLRGSLLVVVGATGPERMEEVVSYYLPERRDRNRCDYCGERGCCGHRLCDVLETAMIRMGVLAAFALGWILRGLS